jgi:cell division septum initiation protein DivIVA
MFRRVDVDPAGSAGAGGPAPDHRDPLPPLYRRSAGSALDALLDTGPGFSTGIRGYDRVQVDNYVAWAEGELVAARRETEDLLTRYGRCAAELEISRRLLAQSPEGQDMTLVSERIGTMLRLAADEAAALTAAGAVEADAIVAEARIDADARLRKAQEIKQLAVATSDRLREDAARMRAEAAAELQRARAQATAERERARIEAEQLTRLLEREHREREAATARAAADQVAGLRAEVEDLQRQRARARDSLRHLTSQLDEALDALAGSPQPPVELVVVGNIARG